MMASIFIPLTMSNHLVPIGNKQWPSAFCIMCKQEACYQVFIRWYVKHIKHKGLGGRPFGNNHCLVNVLLSSSGLLIIYVRSSHCLELNFTDGQNEGGVLCPAKLFAFVLELKLC